MAQILIKIGDQDARPEFFKDGDPLFILEDGATWGRRESKDVWIAEGLAGIGADGVDRSGQTAANWPGGFFILRITTPLTPAAQVVNYLQAHADGIQKRAYKVDTSGINLANGSISATRAQVLARISLKVG
jgi:hypothetical protein